MARATPACVGIMPRLSRKQEVTPCLLRGATVTCWSIDRLWSLWWFRTCKESSSLEFWLDLASTPTHAYGNDERMLSFEQVKLTRSRSAGALLPCRLFHPTFRPLMEHKNNTGFSKKSAYFYRKIQKTENFSRSKGHLKQPALIVYHAIIHIWPVSTTSN